MIKGFLKISQNSLEIICVSLFFNKVAGLRPAILLIKRLRHRCFTVNFAKFLRAHFLQNASRRLLLNIPKCLLYYLTPSCTSVCSFVLFYAWVYFICSSCSVLFKTRDDRFFLINFDEYSYGWF